MAITKSGFVKRLKKMKPSEQDKQAQQEETQVAEQSEQSEAMNIDAANVAVTETDRLDVHSDYDCGSLDGFYCSTKIVRESDIINEILRQAGQQPEATGTLAAEEAQITAKSDANGKLSRVVEQLLPRIERIIIGGQEGQKQIEIEWN